MHGLYDVYIGKVKDDFERGNGAILSYFATLGITDLLSYYLVESCGINQSYGEALLLTVASAPLIKHAIRKQIGK